MRLGKRQSQALALILIVAFFTLAFLYTGREEKPATNLVSVTSTPADGANSLFKLTDFRRSEIKNGKKVWEIVAASGEYFADSNKAKVSDANIWFFKSAGEVVKLWAKEAEVGFVEGSITSAHAVKGFHLDYNQQLQVDSDEADYDLTEKVVKINSPVKITHAQMQTEADSMTVYIEKDEVILSKNVRSVLFHDKKN